MGDQDNKQKQDFADHQAEVSGIPNGKIAKFLTGEDASRNHKERERLAQERGFQSLLDLLLSDPAYAAAYNRVMVLADDAQDKITAAVDRVAGRIEHLTNTLEEMEDKTAKLPDGTCVFRDSEGRLRTADGRHLSEAETASLLNPENLLSYDQYQGVRDALTSARARQTKLGDAQEKLDDAKRKLSDPDSPPPSVDEIEDIADDIQKIIADVKAHENATPTFAASAKLEEQITLENDLTSDIKAAIY